MASHSEPAVPAAAGSSSCVGVRGIIAKLGHADEGVRMRALSSLRFKLANGLASYEELCERGSSDVFPLLLEWFNFAVVPMQTEVLDLMHRICESSGEAATMLAQAGGITFLQAMKSDTPKEHLGIVQAILNLLLLSAPPLHHSIAHPYMAAHSPDASWSDAPSALSPHSSVHTPATVGGISFLSRATAGLRMHSGRTSAASFSAASAVHAPPHASQAQQRLQQQHVLLQQNQRLYQMVYEEVSWEVPLVKLSQNDNQRIFELDVKLKLTDSAAILGALECLLQTLVHDCPAEVLLQKPEVFRNLLALIQTTDDMEIDARALAFMSQWVAALKASLRYQLLAEVASSSCKPPAHMSAHALAHHTLEKAGVLRAEDDPCSMRYPGRIPASITGVLPPHQAAHLIFSKCIPLLQHSSRITSVVLLLRATHPLLLYRCLPGAADWQAQARDEWAAASVKVDCCDIHRIGEHLESLSAVIAYHGWQQVLSCRLRCSLLPLVADLCQAIPEEERKGLIPSPLVQLMFQVAMDPYLDIIDVTIRARFARLLKPLDPAAYSIYEDMCRAWESLVEARSAFAANAALLSLHDRVDGLERVMGGLLYDASNVEALVEALVDTMLALGSANESTPDLQDRVWTLLLGTLACDSSTVRVCAYSGIHRRLEAEKESSSALLQRATSMMLDHEVTYQLVLHGFAGSDTRRHAENVLHSLVAIHGPTRVCHALVCTLPLAAVYVQGGGPGEPDGGSSLSEETRSLMWAAHKVAAIEEQALGLASLMLAQDTAARILAAAELFDLLQAHGCVLLAANLAAPQDPLGFLDDVATCESTPLNLYLEDSKGGQGGGYADGEITQRRHGGGGGAVLEMHELSNLVRIVASESLKEPIRIAAQQQLLESASAVRSHALLLEAGLLDALLHIADSSASAALLTQSLQLLLALLCTPSIRVHVRRWEYVRVLCGLLFHPIIGVRVGAAMCVSHLALSPERLKAASYRKASSVALELDDHNHESCAQSAQSVLGAASLSVPVVFKGKLLARIPAKFYVPGCCHGQKAVGYKDIVARALHRMEQVQEADAVAMPDGKCKDGSKEMEALDCAKVVAARLALLDTSRSHAEFLSNLSELVNVSGADFGLAEEFFRSCWTGSIERILTTVPTSDNDDSVLEALLSAICTMFGALERGRVAPGKTLRFLVHVIKLYLLPTLKQDLEQQALARGDGEGAPPRRQTPRHKLGKSILALVLRLLEHDQSAGARLVTPALQADHGAISILVHYVALDLQARTHTQAPEAAGPPLALSAFQSLVLLTRDTKWILTLGEVGGGRGRGQADLPGATVLFQGLSEDLTKFLIDRYNNSARTMKTGGLVVDGAGGRDPLNSFADKKLVRLSLNVLVQLHVNPPMARMWRRAFFEFSDTQWLRSLVMDRETQVRAMAFSLLSSVAISLVDPNVALAELDLMRQTQNSTIVADARAGAGAGGGDALIQAPQHLEFLNLCCERALEEEEADLVRQQAMDYIICCTRPAPAMDKQADAWSTWTTSRSSYQAENVSSNPRGDGGQRACGEGGGVFLNRAAEVAHEARIASVLQVLNHHKFLDKLVDMLPPAPLPAAANQQAQDESRAQLRVRVLSGAVQVVHNLARTPGTQGVMDSLLSSSVVAQRLMRILDVGALWRVSTCPAGAGTDKAGLPCMQGTLLHRSQWLAVTAPCLLHGAAALCATLRIIIETRGREDGDIGGSGGSASVQARARCLLQATTLVPSLLSLLSFRPTCATSARVKASPDPAAERSLLTEAEVMAKEAAASLLCLLLHPRTLGMDKTSSGLTLDSVRPLQHGDIRQHLRPALRAVLLIVQPLYPPRLNLIGTLLLARLVALVPSAAQQKRPEGGQESEGGGFNAESEAVSGSQLVRQGRAADDNDGEQGRAESDGEEGVEVEVALATRLLAIYHDMFAPTRGSRGSSMHTASGMEASAQEQALVAGLGALLSHSGAAKECCLGAGLLHVLVSSIDQDLDHLSLSDVERKWTSHQKSRLGKLSAPLQRTCAPGVTSRSFGKGSVGGRTSSLGGPVNGSASSSGVGRQGSLLFQDWSRVQAEERDGESEAQVLRLLNLVSNALYRADSSFKEAFLEAGLARTLRRLLSRPALVQHNKTALPLLRGALRVMVNLVAGSVEAKRVMAQAQAAGNDNAHTPAEYPRPTSLLHLTILCCDISTHEKSGRGLTAPAQPHEQQQLIPGSLDESKLSMDGRQRAEAVRNRPWLHDLMNILASCASCGECMPVLLKAGVVPSTLSLLQSAAYAKDAVPAQALLDFVLALSRVRLGQQAMLKVPDTLATLSLARRSLPHHAEIRKRCSLVLRNLCFCVEAKAHVLASQDAMAAIVGDLDGQSSASLPCAAHLRAYAANALWALLYNNQKAKAAFKVQEVGIRDRSMPVLHWLQQEHDQLALELDTDEAIEAQALCGEEATLTGSRPASKGAGASVEWRAGVTVEFGPGGQDRQTLLHSALESMRAALALALDQP